MSSLSSLYTSYHTGSDVKIFLQGKVMIHADLIAGIGYDYNISSIPIYTLGSSLPSFFSKGNALGQGMLVLPFKDEQYLKAMLQYIFEEDSTTVTPVFSRNLKELSDNEFMQEQKKRIQERTKSNGYNIDIGSINSLFNITISLDASSPFYSENVKLITLVGCKITGESMDISSSQDKIVQQAYKFYFKTIERVTL